MTRTLLAYGDSNTYGTPPISERGGHDRFGPGIRWPSVALKYLGAGWDLVEEGLPGRTTRFADPVMGAHMNGQPGLRIALQSHGPIDVLSLMLGTNDLKSRFCPTPTRIAAGIAGLLDIALGDELQVRHGGFQVLLICPAPVLETGAFAAEFLGARAISSQLAPAYQALAEARGIRFFDAGSVVTSCAEDGIHLDAPAHQALGRAIAAEILSL